MLKDHDVQPLLDDLKVLKKITRQHWQIMGEWCVQSKLQLNQFSVVKKKKDNG